jgi:hypothetical protein
MVVLVTSTQYGLLGRVELVESSAAKKSSGSVGDSLKIREKYLVVKN